MHLPYSKFSSVFKRSSWVLALKKVVLFSTVHKILLKRINFYAYKVKIVQSQKQNDYQRFADFATEVLDCIDLYNYLKCVS